jgi:hypothetical protein
MLLVLLLFLQPLLEHLDTGKHVRFAAWGCHQPLRLLLLFFLLFLF